MPMTWAYGVTTVPGRRDLLAATLASLARAGFPDPWLFVDGDGADCRFPSERVTLRYPRVQVAANWVLSLYELYLRNPRAERFAMFQDDLVAVRGLREYLDENRQLAEGRAYLNLYTVLGNRSLAMQAGRDGWFKSNQLGKGALGLVFDNEGVRTLLGSRLIVDRPYDDETRGWRGIDGGISEALCRRGAFHSPHDCNLAPDGHTRACREGWYTEWCHRPSLVQHVGMESTIDKREHATVHSTDGPKWIWQEQDGAEDFPGEDWNVYERMPREPLPKREGQGMTMEEWLAEERALIQAIAGDERRMMKDSYRAPHYARLIRDYKQKLETHRRMRPQS